MSLQLPGLVGKSQSFTTISRERNAADAKTLTLPGSKGRLPEKPVTVCHVRDLRQQSDMYTNTRPKACCDTDMYDRRSKICLLMGPAS